MTKFYILDERNVWHEAIAAAASKRGFEPQRIRRGVEAIEPGWGFIRPHATPSVLKQNQLDADWMFGRLDMVQDLRQVRLYENKTRQSEEYIKWLPDTSYFTDLPAATGFAYSCRRFPIVSKSAEGASSVNVRIIHDRVALSRHIHEIWNGGITVKHCDSIGTTSLQRDYVLLQEFIPHDVTYRVNIIGNGRAVFKRYNYPDRPVAQTGNVEPMMEEPTELLEYADKVAAAIGTKWCALDILQRPGGGYVLLETSLAWPWPSPGACMSAPIFRTKYKWSELFECMFDEIVFGP